MISINAVTEDLGAQGLTPGNFLKSHSLDRRRMVIVRSYSNLKRL